MKRAQLNQGIGFTLLSFSVIIMLLVLGMLIYFIVSRGIGIISWEFLTQSPRAGMTKGGVAPAIVGTFILTLGAIIIALPLAAAVVELIRDIRSGRLASYLPQKQLL